MKKYSEIPGPKLNLIIKGSDALQNTPFEYLTALNQEFPDIARLKAVHLDIVQITNPDYIRQVLQTDQKNYTKSVQYEQLKLILGEGLVTSEGDMWKKQRKLIQPAFHRQQIASFFDIMVDCTNEMLDEWRKAPEGKIDLSEHMMKITLQIIGKTMLSKDVKSTSKEVDKALTFIIRAVNRRTMKALNLPMWLPLPKHQEFEKNVKVLDKIIYDIINERKVNGHGNGDLLDMLMQSTYEDTGEPMPDKLLKDEVMTIFLAGHETTANALSWTMYLLSQHPECIKK
jgi:cytochrome P450